MAVEEGQGKRWLRGNGIALWTGDRDGPFVQARRPRHRLVRAWQLRKARARARGFRLVASKDLR